MEEIRTLERRGLPAYKISSLQSLADKARLGGSSSLHTLLTHQMSLNENRRKKPVRHLKQTDRPNEKLVLENGEDLILMTTFSLNICLIVKQRMMNSPAKIIFYARCQSVWCELCSKSTIRYLGSFDLIVTNTYEYNLYCIQLKLKNHISQCCSLVLPLFEVAKLYCRRISCHFSILKDL